MGVWGSRGVRHAARGRHRDLDLCMKHIYRVEILALGTNILCALNLNITA